MFHENIRPVLEFDDDPRAILEPSDLALTPFDTDRMVVTFFPEVMDRLEAGAGGSARA